jgi:hypothetical protein
MLCQDANDLTLREYPFEYRLEVTHRLTEDSLATTFRVQHRGGSGCLAMPWSAGHHYYFNVPAQQRCDWILTLPCEQWASQDFSNGSYSFTRADWAEAPLSRADWIERMQVNARFDAVTLRHQPSGRALAFEALNDGDWHAVTTWTGGPEEDFFCVEPWSALPDAVRVQPLTQTPLRFEFNAPPTGAQRPWLALAGSRAKRHHRMHRARQTTAVNQKNLHASDHELRGNPVSFSIVSVYFCLIVPSAALSVTAAPNAEFPRETADIDGAVLGQQQHKPQQDHSAKKPETEQQDARS